jgi:hypothetical protein
MSWVPTRADVLAAEKRRVADHLRAHAGAYYDPGASAPSDALGALEQQLAADLACLYDYEAAAYHQDRLDRAHASEPEGHGSSSYAATIAVRPPPSPLLLSDTRVGPRPARRASRL